MSEKRSQFPLPLSSVTGGGTRKPAAPAPVATPQTATQNARENSQAQPRGGAPAGVPGTTKPAQPQQTVVRSDLAATEAPRRAMAARAARQGVKDPQVLAALEIVPRHMFVEPGMLAQAYVDISLPIGHNQTISQPYIVARMIELLKDSKQPLRRVLEIGTGCGYQAAVLSCVAQEVYSIERIKPLHELAKANLRPLRIANLRLQYGDGMLGLPQVAPFDGIILAAAGLEVPRALLEQMAIGARLVAPVGAQVQHLQRITRTGKAEWTSETLEACHFVPLRPGIA
ncbi:protein-L-isoaspartate O-methyltransferase [Massilia sp. Root133]|jgi:protein-L-isoaspartate(D-aspartate) O-methyltransferase|uniref:Protein-L-isoaspartate O-methyltransferase n=1 Tax=Massilia cellulosiltytica TaxID=2683234 RepID=A0A7X3G4K0_9BURK|nr:MULTISPECIES: protein-L-isoaspartate(D-aspartate) O-methyltransferase [Telluria group]KQY01712.1 protein-L-isoaspartate O-methyltransferase [Massilia sp. Root133]KQZ38799.1 protein-L-isoaspartate O-methyltransferase [Massilia sp. Root1485]MVW62562.1 protein-L-isoaspartate(D-aspartate) O-methyltransferase [Telluria cellulosilytica]